MAKNNEAMPQIEKTIDLSLFKRLEGNRPYNTSHVKRLIEAIGKNAENTKFNPILVNEHFEVIDGQHRLEAMKELDLPIFYIQAEGLSLKDAQDLNKLSKPWTPTDYAKSYAELGSKSYKAYLELKSKYHFNHDILMRYVSLDNPITGEMFRAGRLKASDLARTVDLCDKLMSIKTYYDRYNIRAFALAFKTMWDCKQYNHERFLLKLAQKPNAIVDRALPVDYLRDFENLYNHGLEANKKIRFYGLDE